MPSRRLSGNQEAKLFDCSRHMMVKTGKADAFVSAGSTGAVMFAAFAMLGKG